MKTEHSHNDRPAKERTAPEDRFSREIFDTYNDLFKVGELITSEMDYDVLFDIIIKETNGIMDVERCSIFHWKYSLGSPIMWPLLLKTPLYCEPGKKIATVRQR